MAARDHPNRKQTRHPFYDYSNEGSYFVTTNIKGWRQLFGNVVDGQMILSEIGKIVDEIWLAQSNFFPGCRIDPCYIVMPNHFHGIVWIEKLYGQANGPPLPEIMRGFKTFSSKKINQQFPELGFAWQRSYHDRIIRDSDECDRIRTYIENNPSRWLND